MDLVKVDNDKTTDKKRHAKLKVLDEETYEQVQFPLYKSSYYYYCEAYSLSMFIFTG